MEVKERLQREKEVLNNNSSNQIKSFTPFTITWENITQKCLMADQD